MIDSPQQPIDAVRWRERMEDKAPIRYLINTEPHGDHIFGQRLFPEREDRRAGQIAECFDVISMRSARWRRNASASRRPIPTACGWSGTRTTLPSIRPL